MTTRPTLLVLALVSMIPSACGRTSFGDAEVSLGDGGDAAAALGDGASSSSEGGACVACVSDRDCATGARCVQRGGDGYCFSSCADGGTCASDEACTSARTSSGETVSVCSPTAGACAASPPPPTTTTGGDAGAMGDGASASCSGLIAPGDKGSCYCGGSHTCQPNGCYGGYWCDPSTGKCQSPPMDCAVSSGPYVPPAPVTGSVTNAGGKLSALYFGVVGDTRPPLPDDTASYPRDIVDAIYTRLAGLTPTVPFALSTGDYQFSTPTSGESAPQLGYYLSARSKFPGPWFPAMGNHECTGMTKSNCGASGVDGLTTTYNDFMRLMLTPIGQSAPYYTIRVDALDGSWSSKFVFVAANAWDATQASWFEGELAKPTTYTFVVRHEARAANTAPGVNPSEAIMAKYPLTLAIVGHDHTYGRTAAREVTIGNGGAPLTASGNYGFGLFAQRPDGAIQVDMIDYATGAADVGFRFAVHPDGSNATP